MSELYKKLKTHFPKYNVQIKRLEYLENVNNLANIAVFGKFNHGKSTLLNALLGRNEFSTSDKRETVANKTVTDKKHKCIWIDTPGLDADINAKDDAIANNGAMIKTDMILLVHNVKAGELDKYEVKHFNKIIKNTPNSVKKVIVLTQIDQVSKEQLDLVLSKVKKTYPKLDCVAVSATRYLKGTNKNIQQMISLSGIPELFSYVNLVNKNLIKNRKKMKKELVNTILNVVIDKAEEYVKIMELEQERMEVEYYKSIAKLFIYLDKVYKFGKNSSGGESLIKKEICRDLSNEDLKQISKFKNCTY